MFRGYRLSETRPPALCIVLAALLCFSVATPGGAQSASGGAYRGSTRKVLALPGGAADAGEFRLVIDTDYDGMSDDRELENGTDPNDPTDADGDLDGDGIPNGDETAQGTDPNNADSDGDGASDALEIQLGYDPLDPASLPPNSTQLTRIEIRPSLLGLTLNALLGTRPFQLTVVGTLSDGSEIDLTHSPATTYQSLDPAVAIVDDSGRLAAIQEGVTTIRADNSGLSTDAVVNVHLFAAVRASSIALPGFANNVDVASGFAYVACGAAGLQIVDARTPEQPAVISRVQLAGNANDVRISGSMAYVASGSAGLQIVDVSVPAAPVLVGAVYLGGSAVDLAVRNAVAYVATGNDGLKVVDVSEPTVPILVGSLSLPDGLGADAVDVDEARGIAAVVTSAATVAVVDVSNSSSPQFLAMTATIDGAADVAFSSSAAEVVSASGVTAVDTTVTYAPVISGSAVGSVLGTDVEICNGTAVSAADLDEVQFYGLDNSLVPRYDGRVFAASRYPSPTGIAVTDTLVFRTGYSGPTTTNGVSGDSGLAILRYSGDDTDGEAPVVEITSPLAEIALVAGEPPVTVRVRAFDDVEVAGVEIRANGALLATLAETPYQTAFTVPSVPGDVTFQARALDTAGNAGASVPVIVHVLGEDPRTTVTGHVVDVQGDPIAGAVVTLEDGSGRSATSDNDGIFSLAGVGAVPLGVEVSVSAVDSSGEARGRSFARPTVRGGVTDLGLVVLVKGATSLLPAAPSAFGVMGFANTVSPDLFVGFADRQSLVYSSDGQGGYAASAGFSLPFVAARSGAATLVDGDFNFDVLAQAVGQNGVAASVRGDGQGGALGSSSIETGLAGESEMLAAGYEPNGFPNRTVAAFAASDGAGGTTISVRIRDGAGQFASLATLSVAGSVRTIAVEDVTGDGLLDVVASQQASGTDGRLVVFPRTGVAGFGPAVESAILIRSLAPTGAAVDFMLGDVYLNANGGGTDLLVLGDDRMRVYTTDGTGAFEVEDEIALPGDVIPSGLGARRFSGGVAYVVVGRRVGTPDGRVLLVYPEVRGEAARFEYEAPESEGDMRVVIGEFGDSGLADVLVVDSDRITSFLGVGPRNVVDKVSPRPSTHRKPAERTRRR